MNTIFIATGGTGGHIIPARCLAEELSKREYKVVLLADEKYRPYHRASDGFAYKIISAKNFSARNPLILANNLFKITWGFFAVLTEIIKHRPKLVIAFGGYASFPTLLAAVATQTKIILCEQNAYLGKVNRIFAQFADRIALTFKDTGGIKVEFKSKCELTGNPVRKEILALNAFEYAASQEDEKFNILVIGGSGGAKIFSEVIPRAFSSFNRQTKSRIRVVQQCRAELIKYTLNQYESFGIEAEVSNFFSDMEAKLKNAHLVIARSGSSSLAEFCVAKRPMILVPFKLSSDNHQAKNAAFFEKKGAAIVLEEKNFLPGKLGQIIKNFIYQPSNLQEMAQKAGWCTILTATENLANLASIALTKEVTKTTAKENDNSSLGELLKVSREKINFSVKDVSSHLKIKQSVIEMIEGNKLKALRERLGTSYLNRLIKSYAKFLEINPEIISQKLLAKIEYDNTRPDENYVEEESVSNPSKKFYVRFLLLSILLFLLLSIFAVPSKITPISDESLIKGMNDTLK